MHHVIHRAPVPLWYDSLACFGIKATFYLFDLYYWKVEHLNDICMTYCIIITIRSVLLLYK